MAEKDMKDILKELWGSLTDEQKEKAKACKTSDELLKLAGEEGIELPDEVLDAVAGGYIYRTTRSYYNDRPYQVVDDETGKVLAKDLEKLNAESRAKELGVSWAEITGEQLEALRRGELKGPLTAAATEDC